MEWCSALFQKQDKTLPESLFSAERTWALKQTSRGASEVDVDVLYDSVLQWRNVTETGLMNRSSFRHMLLGEVFY